jgi:RimJ/RimL family protein N-acetyltransferase
LRVSERNKTMIGIARKFGFSETYIPRLRGRDEGEFIFSLTDDAWRASPYNKGVSE